MSYPYHQYQDEYSAPSTPQYPQWEVLDQPPQPQDHQQQHIEADLNAPTGQQAQPQQLYHPPLVDSSESFISHSPVEAIPALPHRHSHEGPEASSSAFARLRTSTNPMASQATAGRTALRRSPSARSRNRANPYPRPQSAGHLVGTSDGASTSSRLHRVGDLESAGGRFVAPPPISTSLSSGSEGPSTAPLSAPGRIVGFGSTFSTNAPYVPTPTMLPPTTAAYPGGPRPAPRQRQTSTAGRHELVSRPQKRYIIRSDVQYDPRTQVLTASMELPGVNKSELNVTLSTCLINRIKQVVVSAQASPLFPSSSVVMSGAIPASSSLVGGSMDGGRAIISSGDVGGGIEESPQHYQVRERRYGEYSRTFVVPAETKLEDIDAQMENGLLTLKIQCGPPAESEDIQVVPIR